MTVRVARLVQIALLVTTVLPTKAVWGQTVSPRKLDETLQHAVDQGCSGGPRSVIIRVKAGYRQGMRESLTAHGDGVGAEFTSINAVAAEVHCDDLETLAGFDSTESVSSNANVKALAGVKKLARKTAAKKATKSQVLEVSSEPIALLTALRDEEGKKARALAAPFFDTLGLPTVGGTNEQTNSSLDWQGTLGVSGMTGAGIGVAVVDSGIEAGPDFEDRITHFYDFTYGDVRATTPSDSHGHGTHVAGIVASKYVGVAPAARLVGLKVLNGNGEGTTANVVHAIEFAVANKDLLNIQVLNLSLGHPIFEPAATDPLVQAVEHAVRSGLVVVISAGNFGMNPQTGQPGYGGIVSPGNAPSALTAGSVQTYGTASRTDDRVAPYSSRGPSWYDGFTKPDVVAPGHQLLSVAAKASKLRTVLEGRGNTGNYMRLNGTSMAAGVTSGMVALTLQANRGLTPNALKAVLQYTAVSVQTDPVVTLTPLVATQPVLATGLTANNLLGGTVVQARAPMPFVQTTPPITYADLFTQGAGGINGAGALTLASSIDATVPVGGKWLLAGLDPVSVLGGETVAWSQRLLWGNHFAYGTGVIDENRVAWALNIVWGDFFDDNIVWGNDEDNIVWGNLLDDGDNIVWGNNVVWHHDDNIVWGDSDEDNIVWGNLLDEGDNIVWGNNIVWGDNLIGFSEGDNIVWGNMFDLDSIVWGNVDDDNIVWGNLFDDNIVWGNSDEDNIVWGNSVLWDTGIVNTKSVVTRARRTAKGGL